MPVLPLNRQLDSNLARHTWAAASGGWGPGVCASDVVLIRDVARVHANRPALVRRAKPGVDVQQSERTLPLDDVVERCEEYRRLPCGIGANRQEVRSTDGSSPVDPCAPGPFR